MGPQASAVTMEPHRRVPAAAPGGLIGPSAGPSGSSRGSSQQSPQETLPQELTFALEGFVSVHLQKEAPACAHPFLPRSAKPRGGASRLAFRESRTSRQQAASLSSSVRGSASLRPPVLDESLIQEQTKVDHFWGALLAVWLFLRREAVACGCSQVRVFPGLQPSSGSLPPTWPW